MYKNGSADLNDVQKRAHQWLKSLLDIQMEAGDSSEFLEHVKIDLFPDAVYVFTPKSKIMPLPRGATALDFAYAVHSDLGNQCVAVKINNELLPLRTELKSGDIVEVITAPYSKPNPAWLGFVRTGKARSAIRHYLKTMRLTESVQLGERLVEQSLKGYRIALADVTPEVWDKLVQWTGNKNKQEIFADIGLGRRVAAIMAKRIEVLISGRDGDADDLPRVHEGMLTSGGGGGAPVVITGTEGMSVQLSACCHPIPGDNIMGYIGIGLGMAIHTADCRVAQRIHRRDPGRWIDVAWAPQPGRLFDVAVRVLVCNQRGVFARLAADITSADANIAHIAMDENLPQESTQLRFILQVRDRVHLANVMRRVRTNPDVLRIARDKPSEEQDGSTNGMRVTRERDDI